MEVTEAIRRRLIQLRKDLSWWAKVEKGHYYPQARRAKKVVKKLHREELQLMDQLGELDPGVQYLPPVVSFTDSKEAYPGWVRQTRRRDGNRR